MSLVDFLELNGPGQLQYQVHSLGSTQKQYVDWGMVHCLYFDDLGSDLGSVLHQQLIFAQIQCFSK